MTNPTSDSRACRMPQWLWPAAWKQAAQTLAPLVANRNIILTGSAAASNSLPLFFSQIGAKRVSSLVLVPAGAPIGRWLSQLEAVLAAPTGDVRKLLEEADPTGTALVYAGSYTAQATFCGRQIIGGRRPEHFCAERKDLQAEYMANAHRTIWPVHLSDLGAAGHAIQSAVQRNDTVCSGIPRDCIACGSSHTYLIARGDTGRARAVAQLLSEDCGDVLVAPRDHGVPCTYYGFVTRDWVIDFGPFEALVFWNRADARIAAVGVVRPIVLGCNHAVAARRAVVHAARSIHEATGYTGAFCTDGVLCDGSYIVHEMNPRMCAGFSLLSELCDGHSFSVLDIALREGGADAATRLREPLMSLSHHLSVQRRLVKLWDSKHKSLEGALRSAGTSTLDTHDWLHSVRRALTRDGFIPLIEETA